MEAKEIVQYYNYLKKERSNWDISFQQVAELVWQTQADFTETTLTKGEFIWNKLFDTTAYDSLLTRASSFLGMVWASGKFVYTPVHKDIKNDKDSIEFFNRATKMVQYDLANPKSKLNTSLFEVELYLGSFGTGCLILSENGGRVRFASLDLKEIYIDEDEFGEANVLIRKYELTIEQAIEKYVLTNLSNDVQACARKGGDELKKKIIFLHSIRPRKKKKANAGVLSMPWESMHVEYATNHLVKESGFLYKPFFICRENKKSDEKYGRGAGFLTLADNNNIQTVTKDLIKIFNLYSDPPTGSINTTTNSGVIDKSPGAHTSFESINPGQRPFFNLIEEFNGNPQVLLEFRDMLKNNITKKFDIDVLLDFNSEREMTATESIQRAAIRQQALGSKFWSRIAEIYNPMLETVFNVYFENRKFGYTPKEAELLESELEDETTIDRIPQKIIDLMGKDEPVFEVVYHTPQAKEKLLADAQSTLNIYQNAAYIAEVTQDPSVFDNLNDDEALRDMKDIVINSNIFRTPKEVQNIRDKKRAIQEAQAKLEAEKQLSEIDKNINK